MDELITLDQIGPETIAEYERRAGVSLKVLHDAIIRDRSNIPPNTSCKSSHSLTCNDPTIKATGKLKAYEETKAYKMLIILAEFRDGPPEAMFSLRHAYTAAGVVRLTMSGWRKDHQLFNTLLESIQEEMVDTMRAEAYRRSVVGVEEPVFYQGIRTDTVRKFSDGLLQFTLMGYDAKFRSKEVNMNVSGQLDSNINIEGLRDRLAQRLSQKAKSAKEA